MSKAKLAAAKEFIDARDFAHARAILETLPHDETAQKWLSKLPKATPDNVKRRPWVVPIVGIICLIIGAAVGGSGRQPSQTAQAPNVPSQTTQTPALGTRANPYPIGQVGSIRDGRFRVNSIQRDASADVKAMNPFNTEPAAGEAWALVNVTFYCDLPSDQVCNTGAMQIELVSSAGTVYDLDLFAVLDQKFTGEVFGGGELTGDVGFIINTTDENLIVAVNDLGERVFFSG